VGNALRSMGRTPRSTDPGQRITEHSETCSFIISSMPGGCAMSPMFTVYLLDRSRIAGFLFLAAEAVTTVAAPASIWRRVIAYESWEME
jgi:hypothetical protein